MTGDVQHVSRVVPLLLRCVVCLSVPPLRQGLLSRPPGTSCYAFCSVGHGVGNARRSCAVSRLRVRLARHKVEGIARQEQPRTKCRRHRRGDRPTNRPAKCSSAQQDVFHFPRRVSPGHLFFRTQSHFFSTLKTLLIRPTGDDAQALCGVQHS